MITIAYTRDNNSSRSLRIVGHALSDVVGKDLVCCAVSTLVQTLVMYLESEKVEVNGYMKEGDVYITVNDVRAIPYFNLITFGLEQLADQFNNYITFQKVLT